MRRKRFLLGAFAGILASGGVFAAEGGDGSKAEPAPKPLRALLVTGGCCHDYEAQKKVLTEGISARVRVEWKIIHGGTDRKIQLEVYNDPNWADAFDVIVHNECYGAVSDVAFVERIAKAHLAGKPGVALHCSMHSYRAAKTDAWRKVLGVTSRSHERGRPVTVKVLEENHPIMIGFPQEWRTPAGELYKIEKIWPTALPLAKAYGEDTKKDHTVIWANSVGKCRFFATTLGHHTITMQQQEYLDLVSRGLLWACGKLQEDGTPATGFAAPTTGSAAIGERP